MIERFDENNFSDPFADLTRELVKTVSYMDETLEPYNWRGTNYYIPISKEPKYIFDSLNIDYGSSSLSSERPENKMFLLPERKFRPNISAQLCQVSAKEEISNEEEIYLSLYQVGNPFPLTIFRDSPYRQKMETGTEWLQKGLEAGEYFVLITNAECNDWKQESRFESMRNHLRYSFQLLSRGNKLSHPVIKNVSLSATKRLTISLKDWEEETDNLSLKMYNSDWTQMLCEPNLKVSPTGRITLHIPQTTLWVSGTYSIVLLHNEEPYSLITVEWRNPEKNICTWEDIHEDSPYYIMSKYMEQNTDWTALQQMLGCTTMKREIINRYGYQLVNEQRRLFRLRRISRKNHLAIAVPDGKYDEELAQRCTDLLNSSLPYAQRDCLALLKSKNDSESDYEYKKNKYDFSSQALCLHHLSVLTTTAGRELLLNIEEMLRDDDSWILILMDTSEEISRVFEASPIIESFISTENRFFTENYSLQEQVGYVYKYFQDREFKLSEEAERCLIEQLKMHREQTASWRKKELDAWISKEIFPRFINRVAQVNKDNVEWYTLIESEDLFLPEVEQQQDDFEKSICELNQMVGLNQLKRNMLNLFNRTRFEQKRKEMGLPIPEKGGYHMLFTGNPGTGKTTVAKLVGRIYHSLGLLSEGKVIVAERTSLVGRYIGETERNMQTMLEQARGNVLFIDEAYNLSDGADDKKDFGHRVLESLLTVLAEKNPDMIIILAGYEKEMQQMLEVNPGMKGRFPYKFNFEDYNADELFQIALNLLRRNEYVLTDAARKHLLETIREVVAHKDAFFHNARWIEQYVEDGIINAMSDRIAYMDLSVASKEVFQTIEVADVQVAYQKMKPQPVTVTAPRRRIGFVA